MVEEEFLVIMTVRACLPAFRQVQVPLPVLLIINKLESYFHETLLFMDLWVQHLGIFFEAKWLTKTWIKHIRVTIYFEEKNLDTKKREKGIKKAWNALHKGKRIVPFEESPNYKKG